MFIEEKTKFRNTFCISIFSETDHASHNLILILTTVGKDVDSFPFVVEGKPSLAGHAG